MMAEPPKNRLLGLLDFAKREEVTRTCRYGHGALWRDARAWSLVNHLKPGEEDPLGFHTSELQYRCNVWICRTCGYLELSDSGD